MKAICLPRGNRSSFWAFCSSRLTFFLSLELWMILFKTEAIFASSTDREDFNSSNESTISTSLIHNIASDGKIGTGSDLIFESCLPKQKMIVDLGICRIAAPIFAVFAVQTWNSAEIPPVLTHSWRAFLQMSALELCLYFVCHLLREKPPTLRLVELILVHFGVRPTEFLEDGLGVNQT